MAIMAICHSLWVNLIGWFEIFLLLFDRHLLWISILGDFIVPFDFLEIAEIRGNVLLNFMVMLLIKETIFWDNSALLELSH